MRTPRDIATTETAQFVRRHVAAGARIVEVGCGEGDLAAALGGSHVVVAVDSDAEAVGIAKARGVDARVAAWEDFNDGPFDVVLFTRSLHHIEALDAAVRRAREQLTSEGVVLVEDFAYAQADPQARHWIADVTALLHESGVLTAPEDSFAARLLDSSDPVRAWGEEHEHEHELHSAAAMEAALRQRFGTVQADLAPYLYRYLVDGLPQDGRGALLLARVLRLERAMGARDESFWVGRRWVARG